MDDACAQCEKGTIRLVKLPERPERARLKMKAARFAMMRRYSKGLWGKESAGGWSYGVMIL